MGKLVLPCFRLRAPHSACRRGAQGRVLLVQHVESGEKFVLKQIPLSCQSAEKESAAFSEVDVLSRLSHPNITTLYGAWRSGSMLNILMEYADRGSLADVLKSKAGTTTLFDEDAILDWLVQIVSALRAMHARSILHRDLKAANVFLTSRNLIKVERAIAKANPPPPPETQLAPRQQSVHPNLVPWSNSVPFARTVCRA